MEAREKALEVLAQKVATADTRERSMDLAEIITASLVLAGFGPVECMGMIDKIAGRVQEKYIG